MPSRVRPSNYVLELCSAREAADASGSLTNLRENWLSPDELQTYSLAATAKRKLDWLSARIAAKRAISRFLRQQGIKPPSAPSLEILSDAGRRPYCRAPIPIHISLSHCEDGGLCALTPSPGRIGADWETLRPLTAGVLDFFLHESERTPKTMASAVTQLRLWTLKEAVLKFLGLGNLNPQEIRFSHPEGNPSLFGHARELWRSLDCPEISMRSRRMRNSSIISIALAAGSSS